MASRTRTQRDLDIAALYDKMKMLRDEVVGGRAALGSKGGPIKRALMAGSKPIMDEMKSGAPVGKGKKAHYSKRTGKLIPARTGGLLRDSIRRERMRKPEMLDAQEAVLIRPNPRKAPHFHLVEFGTVKMAARPFMRNAYDIRQGEAVDKFKKKLNKDLDKIVKKLSVK